MSTDFINQRFGRLIVIKERTDLKKESHITVECICDCGVIKITRFHNLKYGKTQSCGCLDNEAKTKHGYRYLVEYNIWSNIKQRCHNEEHRDYPGYGGRGITVCDEWINSFETFYKDMGPRPSLDHSIDRKNNDLGYSKDNCRWATDVEQNNNTSRNLQHTHGGKTKTLAEWCKELDLNYNKTYYRIRKGWTFEEAIQNIQDELFTFNPCSDAKPPETMSLNDWCELLRLNKDKTYLRVLRGETFEDLAKE